MATEQSFQLPAQWYELAAESEARDLALPEAIPISEDGFHDLLAADAETPGLAALLFESPEVAEHALPAVRRVFAQTKFDAYRDRTFKALALFMEGEHPFINAVTKLAGKSDAAVDDYLGRISNQALWATEAANQAEFVGQVIAAAERDSKGFFAANRERIAKFLHGDSYIDFTASIVKNFEIRNRPDFANMPAKQGQGAWSDMQKANGQVQLLWAGALDSQAYRDRVASASFKIATVTGAMATGGLLAPASILGTMATGGVVGAAENVASQLIRKLENPNAEFSLEEVAWSAGIGAALGGAFSVAGRG